MTDKLLLTLIDKINESSLTELDYNDGTTHLVLKKGGAALTPPVYVPGAEDSGALPEEHGAVHLGLPVNAAAAEKGEEIIASPIVATFYASPGPDAPPFVRAGSRLKAGETLCILEAMKMMNHLEAEFDCEVLSVEAASGELVEYGQALFKVKRLRTRIA
ncbi:MAG: acetyl-CoA carboxylase biotin carboxyl carrier protein [Treponema sp.]|jgi:acetyl-CoA carboxylase biotin carboxyl carrier protein|nr:acetyl-CoA carboxylase biotin carboxyl carrier protein [Treponema sp.]